MWLPLQWIPSQQKYCFKIPGLKNDATKQYWKFPLIHIVDNQHCLTIKGAAH